MARKAKTRLNPSFSPRERFNWGYHDAAHDHQRGRMRYIVERMPNGVNPMRYLVRGYDLNYTRGYLEGEQDARDGIYAENSEAAWKRTRKAV